jgi:hypothetical protein
MRVLAFVLAIGIAQPAAAQTPADLARLMSLRDAPSSASAAPRMATGAGAFGPSSLARLIGTRSTGASANTPPTQVYRQAFGSADLARLRDGDFAGWTASPPAPSHLASAMAGGRGVQ